MAAYLATVVSYSWKLPNAVAIGVNVYSCEFRLYQNEQAWKPTHIKCHK